ncbi:hypothetical protein [Nocardia nova]|uniref:hypothetical protein n=1 Tax=Nocardia nova TaxID=37330 RepID=UPI0033E833D3
MPTALWGGVIGSSVTYVITYVRERRKLHDAYRTPQRDAIGGIVAATHELKVATVDVIDHAGLTGRQTSDDAELASERAFERAVLAVEKAFAVGKLSIVDAASYEQMQVAYNEYSQFRRTMNPETISGAAQWTEFIAGHRKSVDILDREVAKLVQIGQRRLSPVQSWRNKLGVKAAQVRLMQKYAPGPALPEPTNDESVNERRLDDEAETYTAQLVDGPSSEGEVSIRRVLAEDIDESYVGRFVGCHDPERGVNYQARILKTRRFDSGPRPGLTVWLRHGQVLDRQSYDEKIHVPFSKEFEILDIATAEPTS